MIDALPFGHVGHTNKAPQDTIDSHPPCDQGQNEFGSDVLDTFVSGSSEKSGEFLLLLSAEAD